MVKSFISHVAVDVFNPDVYLNAITVFSPTYWHLSEGMRLRCYCNQMKDGREYYPQEVRFAKREKPNHLHLLDIY